MRVDSVSAASIAKAIRSASASLSRGSGVTATLGATAGRTTGPGGGPAAMPGAAADAIPVRWWPVRRRSVGWWSERWSCPPGAATQFVEPALRRSPTGSSGRSRHRARAAIGGRQSSDFSGEPLGCRAMAACPRSLTSCRAPDGCRPGQAYSRHANLPRTGARRASRRGSPADDTGCPGELCAQDDDGAPGGPGQVRGATGHPLKSLREHSLPSTSARDYTDFTRAALEVSGPCLQATRRTSATPKAWRRGGGGGRRAKIAATGQGRWLL